MQNDQIKIVPAIMSGGSGTRLWPLSRSAKPKQFHAITGSRSMLAETVYRLRGNLGAKLLNPVVICNEKHAALAIDALDEAGFVNGLAILEPEGKNTAAAAALACHQAVTQEKHALVLLLSADHHITDLNAFHEAILKAAPLAKEGYLVTFGIQPDKPETGYGYIRAGKPILGGFEIETFEEKPDRITAQTYLSQGSYSWNSGSFLLNASGFLKELNLFRPDIAGPVESSWSNSKENARHITPLRSEWSRVASESIDYAVAEKTRKGAIVPVSMGWSDVGSWDAIYELGELDSDDNKFEGKVIAEDTEGCLVKSGARLVALVGCKDLIVVDSDDALLIVPRSNSQKVKSLIDKFKNTGLSKLL